MKTKYLFHPKEYALGLTEKFYTEQALKGWELEVRGAYLSRFAKTEPKQMRYRVEVISPKAFAEWEIPDEQVAVYEDCGWEYVTGKGYIHVFRAPENSDAQEFYLDPAQQADTLKKLRKNYRSSFIFVPLYLILYTGFFAMLTQNAPERWLAQFYEHLITQTGMMVALMIAITWGMLDSLWATIHLGRLYRRMKKGVPLDHSPKGNMLFHRVINGTLIMVALVCILVWATSGKTYRMPETPDGPYLVLADFGVEEERVPNMFNNKESNVRYQRSFLCESWHCQEFTEDEWLYHQVYRMKDPRMIDRFVWSLMTNSTFAQSADDYKPVEVEGLDKAWMGPRLECIGVKGNYICIMTYPFYNETPNMNDGLLVLAKAWENLAP